LQLGPPLLLLLLFQRVNTLIAATVAAAASARGSRPIPAKVHLVENGNATLGESSTRIILVMMIMSILLAALPPTTIFLPLPADPVRQGRIFWIAFGHVAVSVPLPVLVQLSRPLHPAQHQSRSFLFQWRES